ncbi:hypothetical protein R1sor_018208 [Riccia sorocarpa]|uniref:Uncharacterized protein n=1 Tax=Riccia sorocarpa TaxID=122646 RepID=A0ABD3IA30_9MARC
MDPVGFVSIFCASAKKPFVLIYDDEEELAVVEEPVLACVFKLEEGTGSIYLGIEDLVGYDSDGEGLYIRREDPVIPNDTSPLSWNLPHLQSGRYAVYGVCKKPDDFVQPASNIGSAKRVRNIANGLTQPVLNEPESKSVKRKETTTSPTNNRASGNSGAEDHAARGKRKASEGVSTASPIYVSADSHSDSDVRIPVHPVSVPDSSMESQDVVYELDENPDDLVFYDTAIRQFGVEILESEVNDTLWHIARTSGTSPACRARFRGGDRPSRPLCGAYVARQASGKFPAPTFRQPNEQCRQTRFATDRFWFCLNDVCAFGKLVQFLDGRKPQIPKVWPVARGTNLSQGEVEELTKFGFRLVPIIEPVSVVPPRIDTIRSVLDVESFPEDLAGLAPGTSPKTRAGRSCNRRHSASKTKLSTD